ncbi:2Fe-2S iron-sulfur cluster-binding protein [Streptomyces sp. NPDC093111]|uniref:(2Fe-2S)-binding protein n=1 Tax=Streptomyces sp. NPDC093111 TaxID=3154978 RepID=UPI00343AAEC2
MSDETPENRGTGGWQPIPQSEGYDGDATAFVQLPPEFMLEGVPLEAPGHGYVPPMITPLVPLAATDPTATGTWPAQGQVQTQGHAQAQTQGQVQAERAPEEHPFPQAPHFPHGSQGGHAPQVPPGAQGVQGAQDFREFGEFQEHREYQERLEHRESQEHREYQERLEHRESQEHQGFQELQGFQDFPQEQTASWTIPTIEDGSDVLDDSGEYTAARLAPYAAGAPATLPGGAPAPWAVQEQAAELPVEPEPVPEPAGERAPDGAADHAPDQPLTRIPDQAADEVRDQAPDEAPEPAQEQLPDQTPEAARTQAEADAQAQAQAQAEAQTPDAPALPPTLPADPLPPVDMSTDSDEHPTTSYALRVNGADRPVTDSWIGESLLYVLRERLGLAGAKDGCSQGECGACNVQVDGRLVASCLVPAATAAGCEVRTVEGLAVDGEPSDVQRALAKCGVQCGFCIPGMAMTVHDLLEGNHAPNELETRQALCGNLCRCSGYRGVLEAVQEVVSGREAAAEAETGEEARIPHQIPHPFDGGTA